MGGLLRVMVYGRITRHASLGNLMRIGLIVKTFTHLALELAHFAHADAEVTPPVR